MSNTEPQNQIVDLAIQLGRAHERSNVLLTLYRMNEACASIHSEFVDMWESLKALIHDIETKGGEQ